MLRPRLGGPFRRGTRFKVTDTVLNDAPVGMPRSTTTRYYLSADSVAIRATTRPGTYVLLACADDTKVVAEGNETNNCRASGTPIVVSP